MTASPSSDPNQSPRDREERPTDGAPDLSRFVITNSARDALKRYFAGLVEHVLQTELKLPDPELCDYATGILLRFSYHRAVEGLRNLAGTAQPTVAEMLVEAENRRGHGRREAYRYIGDYTLYNLGLYPEHTDFRELYTNQGKRSYYLASRLLPDDELRSDEHANSTLALVSDHFELLTDGFSEVRKYFEKGDGDRRILI